MRRQWNKVMYRIAAPAYGGTPASKKMSAASTTHQNKS